MDNRILIQMIRKLNLLEQKEKSVQEAELQFSIQRDIEKIQLSKRGRRLGY